MTRSLLALLSMLASCASVSHTLDARVAAPHSIAVLPVEGTASLAERELARGLFAARLRERGFLVADSVCVDRALSERRWMQDPDAFAVKGVPLADIATELGVDGLLLVSDFDETNWNAVVVRRHSLSAQLRIVAKDGAVWWSARGSAGETGGFLLKSGQALTELLAQSAHGTGAASIAKLDALVEDLSNAMPRDEDRAAHATPPAIAAPSAIEIRRTNAADGTPCISVMATAQKGALMRVEVGDSAGVPMAGPDQVFVASVPCDPAADPVVRVRARSMFGSESVGEKGGSK